jgi:hypothetical protein
MATVSEDLDQIQRLLHDSGTLWPRTELLQHYNDAYRQLLAQSHGTRDFEVLTVPPRHTMTITYPWERRHVLGGTYRQWTYASLTRQHGQQWEVEQAAGLTPLPWYPNVTQLWESVYASGTVDQYTRFALPVPHERLAALWYDHALLEPLVVRELDTRGLAWYRTQGELFHWAPGLTHAHHVEVYQTPRLDGQVYALSDLYGTPRALSGARTYTADVPDPLGNSYAYTCDGDAQALTWQSTLFSARSAYTDAGDIGGYYADQADLHADLLPTTQWTLTSSRHDRQCCYTWEAGVGTETEAGLGRRGQWPWEAAHGATVPAASQQAVGVGLLTGLGWRFTQDAVNDYHCTYAWEAEMHAGVTSDFTASDTIGTYSWEAQHGAASVTFALGTVRAVESSERQYWPQQAWSPTLGVIRQWASSEGNVLAWHVLIPDAPLVETDLPVMVPGPLQKYLRYYTLARAFAREGEGYNTALAEHWLQRWARGPALLQRLGDSAHAARTWQRQPTHPSGRSGARVPYLSSHLPIEI